jgi:hypothetical protein
VKPADYLFYLDLKERMFGADGPVYGGRLLRQHLLPGGDRPGGLEKLIDRRPGAA